MNEVRLWQNGFYGVGDLPPEIFDKLDPKYFISGCTDTVKYMCANEEETQHLENLGIDTSRVVCDWYRLMRRVG